jgi:RNA recognition motif-containing protein
MRDLARNNLYFKGFPCDGSIEDLNTELRTFFEKFGEVKTLKLPTRMVTTDSGSAQKETLLGFGFVSFQTLESAQKCRFDVNKELFKSVYKIYANPFEWKELRKAHKMEQVDQKELYRYLQNEHSKKANEVLTSVKEDLRTEQG